MAGLECSPPLCSPTEAEPPHSSPQWWSPLSKAWLFSSPVHALRSRSRCSSAGSSSLHKVLFSQCLIPGPARAGGPRGAWILGNEAARDSTGWSHHPTPREGSPPSVLFLHLLHPLVSVPLPFPWGSLGPFPAPVSLPGFGHCRGSVYFK